MSAMDSQNVNNCSWVTPEVTGAGKPERNQCCCLCQSVHKLCALFASDVASENLKMLISQNLQIQVNFTSDSSTYVCEDCVDRLKSFQWFAHQGRNNDMFLKYLPKEQLPQEEKYCRLCLSTNDQLQAVFVENTPQLDNPLCELVKECIRVELDYHRDFTSHVCSLCRTQLEMFVTFKRIAQQIQKKHADAVDAEENSEAMEVDKSGTKACRPLSEAKSKENGQNADKVIKKRRRRRTKAEMALARAQAAQEQAVPNKQQSKVERILARAQENANKSPTVPKSATKIIENNSKNITDRKKINRMLWAADDERNFEVIKDKRGRARVCMDGFTCSFGSMKPDGTSQWFCDYKTVHNCKFKLTISANGKIATVDDHTHSHDKELIPLLKCPLGKGILLNDDGTEEVFWLFNMSQMGQPTVRHLIYQGYRYVLRSCYRYHEQDTSLWECRYSKCTATVEVCGLFEKITVLRSTHNHSKLSNQEFRVALKDSKVSFTAGDVITPFRRKKDFETGNEINTGLAPVPDIYVKLSTVDETRDFVVIQRRDNVFKIRYQGYDYKLCLKQLDGSTIWQCIWESIHSCKAVIVVTKDGSKAAHYGLVKHNHPLESSPIIQCEPKQYSVRNIANDANEHITLLARECKYFQSRTILFRCHLYNLYQIVKDESRWSCIGTDSQGQQCSGSLIIAGAMDSFLQKGVHCHMPMSKSDIRNIIKPGNIVELSALKPNSNSTDEAATEPEKSDDVLDMLKQQLLSSPMGRGAIWDKTESKSNPFYFIKDQTNKNEEPYKFFYQQHRYAFASIDEYGISQWVCCKLVSNAMEDTCTARVTIEGVFQRVSTRGSHNHLGIPQSMVEYLCSQTAQRMEY